MDTLQNAPLPLREKAAYTFGSAGDILMSSFISGFLLLFATDVLYINPVLIGSLLFIPRILDIFTDFLVMGFVDRTRTKWGTYRPWLLTVFPVALCFLAMFACPSFCQEEWEKALYITGVCVFYSAVFETAYWAPYVTLGGVMSPDRNARLSLVSCRSVGECLASVAVVAAFPLLSVFGSSYQDIAGWQTISWIFAGSAVLCALLCFFTVRERVPVQPMKKGEKTVSFSLLATLFKNRYFRHNTALLSLLYLPWYAFSSLFSYYCIYVLGEEEWFSSLSLISLLLATLFSLLADAVIRRVGRRKAVIGGTVLMLISLPLLALCHTYLGTVAFVFIKNAGLYTVYVALFARLPEVAEHIRATVGVDRPGLVFGVTTSCQKLFAATGAFLASLFLSLGGYDAALQSQSPAVSQWIVFGSVGLFAVACTAILFLSLSMEDTLSETV